jgi:dihydropteroate synthase
MIQDRHLTPHSSLLTQFLQCGRFKLSLGRPLIMGVVNVTPDSFSDGGLYLAPEVAIAQGRRLIAEGAGILDIGGESSRPGAGAVAADEELARVVPVVRALRDAAVPVSVDTTKPEVMRAALGEGASMVNDITALGAPGALEADDVVRDVQDFLSSRVAAAEHAGIARERIVIDPGFGFGKTVDHNLDLLRRLREFGALGVPVLAGLSRKSTLGSITGRPAGDRVAASVAAALIAVQNGARIVRVHDVAATRDALAVWQAVQRQERQ